MPKSFTELLREFEAAGRVQPYVVIPKEQDRPVAPPAGHAANLRAYRERKQRERVKQAEISKRKFRTQSERIKELGLEGFKKYSKEQAPAGKRRFLRDFKAKQVQSKRDVATIEQQGRLELEEYKIQGRARLKAYDRELSAEDRVRKTRNDEILNQYRQAQTRKIKTAPQFEQFQSNLKRIEEGDKARHQVELESFKQENREEQEYIAQRNRSQLAQYKAALKLPKESFTQELIRLRNTGALRTNRDIALHIGAKKFSTGGRGKPNMHKLMLENALAVFGASPFDVPWIGGKQAKTDWGNLPLPGMVVNQRASYAIEQYGDRQSAEAQLKATENRIRQQAHAAGQKVPEDIETDIAAKMAEFDRRWPDQPSTYTQLGTYDPGEAAVSNQALGFMNKQLDDLFVAGYDGSAKALGELKDIGTTIADYFGRTEQAEERAKDTAARKKRGAKYKRATTRELIERAGGRLGPPSGRKERE